MALTLDGSAISGHLNTASSLSITLSTTNTNDVVIVAILTYDENSHAFTGISDTAGLTWTLRKLFTQATGFTSLRVYYAIASSALTNDVITATTASNTYMSMSGFGVSGANTGSPFDSNAGLPATNSGASGPQVGVTFSTSNANDFIYVVSVDANIATAAATVDSGYTIIQNVDQVNLDIADEYKVVSATQSSVTALLLLNGTGQANWIKLADAIVQAAPVAVPRGLRRGERFRREPFPLRGRRGLSRRWGRTPRVGVTTRPVPRSVITRKRRKGVDDIQPPQRMRGRVRLWGRTPRVGVTTRPAVRSGISARKRGIGLPKRSPPPSPSRTFFAVPRNPPAVVQSLIPQVRVGKRGHGMPTDPRGRGKTSTFGRTPRVGATSRQVPPTRTKKRATPLPRGRFRPFGRSPRIGVTTRPAPLGVVRTKKRAIPLPRGRPRQFGRTPRIGVTSRPAQLASVRTKRRLTPVPRGRSRLFGRTPRVGVTTRPSPPESILRRRRLTPLPRGRVRREGWVTRPPPAVVSRAPPALRVIRGKRYAVLRSRRVSFGRRTVVFVTVAAAPPGFRARRGARAQPPRRPGRVVKVALIRGQLTVFILVD